MPKEDATRIEIEQIALHKSTNPNFGYNQSTGGGGFSGIKLSDERRMHLSKVKKGKNPHIWTEEMRKKQSEVQKGHVGYTKGKHLTEEHRQRISAGLMGHKVSDAHIEKFGKPVLQFSKDGKLIARYRSQKEAARIANVNISSIYQCCIHKRKTAKGFIFEYERKEANG